MPLIRSNKKRQKLLYVIIVCAAGLLFCFLFAGAGFALPPIAATKTNYAAKHGPDETSIESLAPASEHDRADENDSVRYLHQAMRSQGTTTKIQDNAGETKPTSPRSTAAPTATPTASSPTATPTPMPTAAQATPVLPPSYGSSFRALEKVGGGDLGLF